MLSTAMVYAVLLAPAPAHPHEPSVDSEAAKLERLGCTLRREGDGAIRRVISIALGVKVRDVDLKTFRVFSELEYLTINSPDLTDDCLVSLKPLKNLRSLAVIQSRFTDEKLARVLSGFTHLERIMIHGGALGDLTAIEVTNLAMLRDVSFFGSRLTDRGLENIGKLVKLRSLNLGSTQITGVSVSRLNVLKDLDYIFVNNTRVSEKDLALLKKCASVKVLGVSEDQVGKEGLASLKQMPGLERLILSPKEAFGKVPDGKINEIKTVLNLVHLEIIE